MTSQKDLVPGSPDRAPLDLATLKEAAWGRSALLREPLEKPPSRWGDLRQYSSRNQYNSVESLLLSLNDVRLPLLRGQERVKLLQQTMAEIIGALHSPTQALVYLIQGDGGQVRVSFGAVPLAGGHGQALPELTEGAVRACLPGAQATMYQGGKYPGQARPLSELLQPMDTLPVWGMLTGIPALGLLDSEQRVFSPDHILHGMQGDQFAYLVVAQPMEAVQIGQALEETVNEIAYIHPKILAQLSQGEAVGESITDTQAGQLTWGTKLTFAAGAGTLVFNPLVGALILGSAGEMAMADRARETKSTSTSETRTEGREFLNQAALFYEQALSFQAQRLLLARNQGLWQASVFLAAGKPRAFNKLAGLTRMTFSKRPASNEPVWNEPIRSLPLREASQVGKELSLVTMPIDQIIPTQSGFTSAHPLPTLYPYALTTPLLTEELAALMNLPQEEYPGYRVREETKFSVYIENAPLADQPAVEVGAVCDRGETLPNVSLRVPLEALTGHTLIAGVTGAGKTTTCQGMLRQLADEEIPFLVIEPAKTEYRALFDLLEAGEAHTGLQIFTLGNETISPFRLNPFEISPGVNVQAHIDLLKDSITTAFTMWGPLPQMIEWALIHTYKARGWDLVRGVNPYDPKRENPDMTPTLDDFYRNLEKAADHFGYAGEVGANIRAALLARIDSLRRGAKGLMLNTRNSVPMETLLQRPTILELKDVGDDSDKAFIIGLMLIRLYEWLDVKHRQEPAAGLRHVLVIEEAHRLFRNAGPAIANEHGADPRAKAVETFSNIMSEVRAYGEGVIILDQIPTRLAPDAIKNTNIRIIHRIVSRDDRDYIGLSINLAENELDFLIGLPRGEVVFHRDGMIRPAHLRITPRTQGATTPSNEQVQQRMMAVTADGLEYLWRHPGCRQCRQPCVFLTRAESISGGTFSQAFYRLSRMLVLVILTGSPGRASAALGFVLSRFKGWLKELALSAPEDEVMNILWCALGSSMTSATLVAMDGLAKARQAQSLKEGLVETLESLFEMRRSGQFSGAPHDAYLKRRDVLLETIREHNQGQCGPGVQAGDVFSPLARKAGNLPVEDEVCKSTNLQIKWSVQQAFAIWLAEGGQEAQEHRLLLPGEIQQAIYELALCIFWQRFVEHSDLGILDKDKVFSKLPDDIRQAIEEFKAER